MQWKRVRRGAVAGVALVAVLAACYPKFPTDGSVTATADGTGVLLEWSAAIPPGENTIASYRIDVDGVEVSRVEGTSTACTLSGLTPGESYAVSITAYDSGGTWSGSANKDAALSTEVTGPSGSDPNEPLACDEATPSIEEVLEEAPAEDPAAVEAFEATAEGQVVVGAVADVAGLSQGVGCAAALAAVADVLSADFLAGIATSPDPIRTEAYWSIYAGASALARGCEVGTQPQAKDVAAVTDALALLEGRTNSGLAARSSTTDKASEPTADQGLALGEDAASTHRSSVTRASGNAPVWWALGDSFSSGEGIPGTDPSDRGRDLQGKTCQRGNVSTSAKAWPTVAYEELFGAPDDRFQLVACTGDITDDLAYQVDQARTWSGASRPDVISVGFGGNNVNFGGALKNCLDIGLYASRIGGPIANALATWKLEADQVPDLRPGCDRTEGTMRQRVTDLTSPSSNKPPIGEVTTREMLDALILQLKPGGHLIVAGYPMIFEDPAHWSLVNLYTRRCQGVWAHDVRMIRNVQGTLNLALYQAVQDAKAAHPGVQIHWLDPSQVYENIGGRHGLCSRHGNQWLNGFTTSIESGDLRVERSYHPNQAGHTATGHRLAVYLDAVVDKNNLALGETGELVATGSDNGLSADIANDGSIAFQQGGQVMFSALDGPPQPTGAWALPARFSISDDGSHIAFAASNGVAVWSRSTGAIDSLDFAGEVMGAPTSSMGGDFILFATSASLDPGDTNMRTDLYRWHRPSGSVLRLTHGNDDSGFAYDISADGTIASFHSRATDLTPEWGHLGSAGVFSWTEGIGTTQIATTVKPDLGAALDMSADGRFVSYSSQILGSTWIADRTTPVPRQMDDNLLSVSLTDNGRARAGGFAIFGPAYAASVETKARTRLSNGSGWANVSPKSGFVVIILSDGSVIRDRLATS